MTPEDCTTINDCWTVLAEDYIDDECQEEVRAYFDRALGQTFASLRSESKERDSLRAEHIPRTLELLDCTVEEACEKRWEWGKNFPVGTRLEDEGSGRVAIYEAYEEVLDCLNYLKFEQKQFEQEHGLPWAPISTYYRQALELAEGLRQACILTRQRRC